MSVRRSSSAAIAGLVAIFAAFAAVAQSAPPPSVKMGRGQLLTPAAANAVYGSSTCHTYGPIDTVCREALPAGYVRHIDVRTAARALGAVGFTAEQYVNAVYEFVRNGVDTEFRYGLDKGARGVLIDRSGTPFDQAHLMVELLAEGGITARYKMGTIVLNGAQFSDWTTLTSAKAACRLLANGAVPAVINGSTSSTCAYGVNDTVSSVTMGHVWVEAVIGGASYAFDPSLKSYTRTKLLDMSTVPGYAQSTFITNALSTAVTGTFSGAAGVRLLNQTGIESGMSSFSNQVLSRIATTHPTATREELLGIPQRVRVDLIDTGPRVTTLPYATATRTIDLHVPDTYRTGLTVNARRATDYALTRAFFVDDIYGERLVLRPVNVSVDRDLQLVLGDTVLNTVALLDYPSNVHGPWDGILSVDQMTLSVNHPYADQGGAYMDQSFSTTFMHYVATAIAYGSGPGSSQLANRWQQEVKQDRFMPQYLIASTEQYLGGQATQDKVKLLAASEWMRQLGMALETLSGVSDTVIQHHHSVGVSFSDVNLIAALNGSGPNPPLYGAIADHVVRTTFSSGLSVAHRTGNDADATAAERASAALAATLEASVSEQLTDSPEASSAHTRFVWGRQFTSADSVLLLPSSTNVSTVSAQIRPSNCASSGSISNLDDPLQQYLTAGYNILVHQNTCLGPGPAEQSIYPASVHYASTMRGAAFIAYKPDFSEIAHIQTNGENLVKGAGAPGAPTQFEPAKSSDLLRDDFKSREAFGVDLNSGKISYSPPPDITIGTGEFPYSLSLQRSFKAGAVPLGSFREGWTHNLSGQASMGSSGIEAMGATRPQAMAESVAALYVTYDVFRNATTLQNMLIPSFVQHWWHQKLVGNTVTITQGANATEFVRLADGTWAPPAGAYARLSVTGSRVITGSHDTCPGSVVAGTWNNIGRTPNVWGYGQVGFDVTGVAGDVQHFGYWCVPAADPETPRLTGLRLTTWSFPAGVTLTFSYNTEGALQTVSNSLGRALTFTHTSQRSREQSWFDLQTVSDGAGRSVIYGYGLNKELTSVTLPDAALWKYQYTTFSPTDSPLGYPADQRPNDFYQLHKVFEPVNATIPAMQVDYDGIGSVKSVTDATALQIGGRNPWTYFITPQHVGEQINPTNSSYRTYYDNNARAYRWVDELGRKTAATYDNLGRLATRTYPEGNSVTFQYDVRSNVTERRLVAKAGSGLVDIVTGATYPASCTGAAATCNKPMSESDPRSKVTNYLWDATSGLLKQVLKPADDSGVRPRTDYCYSTFGTLKLLTGQVQNVTATRNRVITFTYNAANKYVPASATADPTSSLDATCAAVSKSGALDLVNTFTYDAYGNIDVIDGPRTDVVDTINTDFDLMRRITRVAAPGSSILRNQYDLNGRLIKLRRARIANPTEPSIVESEWQSEGRDYWPTSVIKSVTDAENHVTRYDYDGADRNVLVTDPDNRRIGTVYDYAGQVSCLWKGWQSTSAPTNCAWNPATYAANGNNGQFRYATYTYTLNGKQKSVQDAGNNITEYALDGFDRLAFTLFPDPASGDRCTVPSIITSSTVPSCSGGKTYEKSTYDAAGNRTAFRTRRGDTIASVFDGLNRQVGKTVPNLPTVTYAYNLVAEPITLSSPALGSIPLHTIGYDYDDAGRKLYENNDGRSINYVHDKAGNRTRITWHDAYAVHYTYDEANRMDQVWETAIGTGVLMADYTYDPLSRRSQLQLGNSPSNRVNYSYEPDNNLDNLLQTFNSTTVTLNYGHNNSGQITTIAASDEFYLERPAVAPAESYVTNALNQYSTVSGSAVAHDLNGNMTSWISPNIGLQTYTYDAENRLRTVSASGLSVSYDYDPLGRRVSKTVNGTVTRYLLDADEEVAELDGGGQLAHRYVTGPAIDDRIAHVQGSALANPTKMYYHVNHQGSVMAMSDAAGNVSQRMAYDEFGKLSANSVVTGEQFRFTGRRFDPETGLYYYRARYYSPILGRFLQTDPIGYGDDLNLYAYTRNDPPNHTDPTGAVIDTIADIAFIAYDIYAFATEPSWTNAGALGADVVGAVVPFATGLGAGVRAVDKGADVAHSEGIVYERINKADPLEKPYFGRAKSEERYAARQKEHGRANPDADYEFKEVDRAEPGRSLREAEQGQITAHGGPTNKSNPNGGTSNKRNEIGKRSDSKPKRSDSKPKCTPAVDSHIKRC